MAHLTNLIEASQKSPGATTVERHGGASPSTGTEVPQGKDSAIGRKVAKEWRTTYRGEPQFCVKTLGTGHRSSQIKVYPEEFFQRIIAIAQEYLG